MTRFDLLKNLDAVAHVAGGADVVRGFILDLALQGKLSETSDDDEPVGELLRRIERDSEALRADLGLRRSKKSVPLTIPTGRPIPDTWQWVQLADLGLVSPRNDVDDDRDCGFIPMALIPVSLDASHKIEVRRWGDVRKSYTHVADGDVAVAKITPCFENAKSTVFRNLPNGVGAATTELHVLRPTSNGVVAEYVLLFLKAPAFIREGAPRMTGTAGQKRLPRDYFAGVAFPLPPREEQQRIVATVGELMALCDELETSEQDRRRVAVSFRDSSLDALTSAETDEDLKTAWFRVSANWSVFAGDTRSLGQLRRAVFRLAVQGRLVPQSSHHEPAEALLVRLRELRTNWLEASAASIDECKTMLRKLAKLEAHEDPYPLPVGWASARLIDLCYVLVDCHNKTAPYAEDGIPIVRTSNIRNGQFVWEGMKFVDEETYARWSRRCPPEPGDIIFTREAPMGEAALVPHGQRVCLGQRTMLIRPVSEFIDRDYLLIALIEPGLLERSAIHAKGATVKHFRVGDVENFVLAVPPLEEQLAIVRAVHRLSSLLEEADAAVSAEEQVSAALAASFVA